LREYRSQWYYDSADSECKEIRNNIVYYKLKTEEAKGTLEEPKLGSVEPCTVEPGALRSGSVEDSP
jgi:hypothetical protein